jgi:hypothetical protein
VSGVNGITGLDKLRDRNYARLSQKMHRKLEVRGEEASVSGQLCGSALGCVVLGLCPFKVLGMSLQLSIAPNKAFYESPSTEISRLAIAKSHEIAVKERSLNAIQLSSGSLA